MNFDVKTEQLGDSSYVISLAGEVDLYTAPEFKQQLLEVLGQGAKHVVVEPAVGLATVRLALAAPVAALALAGAGCGTGGVAAKGNTQSGEQLFKNHCAFCHTLASAGANGKTGPNLDDAFAGVRRSGRDWHFQDSTIRQVVADQIKFPA